ncbi:MAG: GNAT family N-acetyltransferase [Pseudomonadales bacterium]|jgi:putative acetyltransferase
MAQDISIKQIDPNRDDVDILLKESDKYLRSLYPDESNHLDYADELSKPNYILLGAFRNDSLLGIGAVKLFYGDGYGEVKRVFVDPLYRGQGLAKAIMSVLEAQLVNNNILLARLETGNKQAAAIQLYKLLGYQTRGPFGQYVIDPLSIFMEKPLQHN